MARRLVKWAILLAALAFAVFGGEYGTDDLLAQRARKLRLEASLDSLRRDVDSLARVKKAILSDPAVQERIAREEYGMVRSDKELLYRFAPDSDSTSRR